MARGISGVQRMFSLIAEVAMPGFVGEKSYELGAKFAEFVAAATVRCRPKSAAAATAASGGSRSRAWGARNQ
jgi:hypothetical protein